MAATPLFPVLVVVGPTGSGKSQLGLALATAFQGEIVNCDSVQVYRGLDVGSAKVPVAERRGIPHHLLDLLDPAEELTAGAYSRLARPVLVGITRRRAVPVVVGGTGLYLRSLLDGLSPAPERNTALRSRLTRIAERRPRALHCLLRGKDPLAARRIHPNDVQKLIRALELTLAVNRPATLTQSQPRDALVGAMPLKLGLNPDRAALCERLDRRTASLFESGLLSETQRLLNAGVSPQSKPLQSLGYKQAVLVLTGRLSVSDAIRECQVKTRQYAKRQMTWFRSEPDVHWIPGFGDNTSVQNIARSLADKFLQDFNGKGTLG